MSTGFLAEEDRVGESDLDFFLPAFFPGLLLLLRLLRAFGSALALRLKPLLFPGCNDESTIKIIILYGNYV